MPGQRGGKLANIAVSFGGGRPLCLLIPLGRVVAAKHRFNPFIIRNKGGAPGNRKTCWKNPCYVGIAGRSRINSTHRWAQTLASGCCLAHGAQREISRRSHMRTRMLTFLAVLTLGAVICLPGMAMADWSQGWTESITGGQQFDQIDAFILNETAGNVDFGPGNGITNLSPGTWVSQQFAGFPDFAVANNSPQTSISFTTNFLTANNSNPFTLDLFALLNGVVVDTGRGLWNGASWDFSTSP